MFILINSETKLVKFAFDTNDFELLEDTVKLPDGSFVADQNADNTIIVEDVTLPEDFFVLKYMYDSSLDNPWVLNTSWRDIDIVDEAPPVPEPVADEEPEAPAEEPAPE